MPSGFIIQDGIGIWFEGPEWGDVVTEVFRDYQTTIQSYAQENAPWADRTGAAREGLETEVDGGEEGATFTLAHTVDYGQWLEVIQNGEFAIILPTLEAWAPEVMREAAEKVAAARRGVDY